MARKINNTNTQATENTQAQQINGEVDSTRALHVEGQTVIADLTVRKSRDGEPVNLQARIDFTGCTATQILLWAARTKIIDLQRALRLCDLQFLKDLAKRGPIIRKATEAGTSFVDPAKQQQQILSKVQNMTPEERAALIKLLQQNI